MLDLIKTVFSNIGLDPNLAGTRLTDRSNVQKFHKKNLEMVLAGTLLPDVIALRRTDRESKVSGVRHDENIEPPTPYIEALEHQIARELGSLIGQH